MARRRDEAIDVREKRFNYFPQRFVWHGKSYGVQKVERCWTVSGPTRDRPVRHLFFRVRCQDDRRYDIYQDLSANTWHISRVWARLNEDAR